MTSAKNKIYILYSRCKMNYKKLKNIADKIFESFAEAYPEAQKGRYLSAKTNLVLAFDEYINHNNIQAVAKEADIIISAEEAKILLKMMNDGIEKYLEDNIKVIALN
mgnify:CR=1 FL=1